MNGTVGTIVGNYRLVRELGAGGMGAVFEAVDTMLERPVAIKMLRPEIARQPELIDRFRVEAVTLARLNHPSIATLYSFIRERDEYYMVMEFVPGRTFEAMLDGGRRLAPTAARDVLGQVLEAMAHAHTLGVLHRDIKPANIMVTSGGAAKVMDFGIARILGSSRMTREGRIIGTLEYMAPERIRGEEADIRSDLYSAGVVLYEALAGRLPFVSDTDYGMIQAQLKEPPPPLRQLGADCPPGLESVLCRALEKDAAKRFQSAEEFRDALLAATPSAGKPTRLAEAATALPATREVSVPPKLPTKWLAGGGAALVVLAAGLFLLARSRETAPSAPPPQPPAAAVREPERAEPEQRSFVQIPAAVMPMAQTKLEIPELKAAASEEPEPPAGPATIRAVRRLYIVEMADGLDRYLRDEIRKQLGKKLKVVSDRENADAVMGGRGERRSGAGKALTFGVKAGFTGSVAITDLEGNKVLWQSEAGDNSAFIGVLRKGGPKKVAERLVNSLKKALDGK